MSWLKHCILNFSMSHAVYNIETYERCPGEESTDVCVCMYVCIIHRHNNSPQHNKNTCIDNGLILQSEAGGLDKWRHESQLDPVNLEESLLVLVSHLNHIAAIVGDIWNNDTTCQNSKTKRINTKAQHHKNPLQSIISYQLCSI